MKSSVRDQVRGVRRARDSHDRASVGPQVDCADRQAGGGIQAGPRSRGEFPQLHPRQGEREKENLDDEPGRREALQGDI
eukprot:9114554-Pyramimonas_sp.AAC.1